MVEGSQACLSCEKASALKQYDGPSAFLIPGNHDWIDGLETFQRHIIHKGWIGGWLLPQEKSYFALKLPHGWWLFALDLALVEDIDMCQYRYFAKVAEERMAPGDAAIMVTHCPLWLIDWFWGHHSGKNLRQLIRGPLRGKVRLKLAGDLHFYMRHSFKTYGNDGSSPSQSTLMTPAGGSPLSGGSPPEVKYPDPTQVLSSKSHPKLITKLNHIAKSKGVSPEDPINTACSNNGSPLGESPPANWWPSMCPKNLAGESPPELQLLGGTFNDSQKEWEGPPDGWILNEAEHLVVCGSGGAFLHPTHVFSYSRFRPIHDPAAGPIHVRPHSDSKISKRRSYPSSSSLYSMRRRSVPKPAGGEYRCMAAFPTADDSLKIGRSNLYTFRHVNSRFDLIGGMLYFLLVISTLPRCAEVDEMFNATSIPEALYLFFKGIGTTFVFIFSKTYVSCAAFGILFLVTLSFARSGGIGAISGVAPAARRKPEYRGFPLAVKARMGGFPAQFIFALAHACCHFFVAISLLLLMELGIETVIRYEGVGKDGYHSLYRWYRAFEVENFPDPSNLRGTLSRWTFSIYPNLIKWLFAAFDVPEAIAVSRTASCLAGGSFAALTRIQTLGYYLGVLLYFWVLATPTVGLLFGLYLYISGNWLHVHYDESFSALQIEDRKAFLRMHIDKRGNLEIYALGLKDIPKMWREDPGWTEPGGGGMIDSEFSHRVARPSRWTPVRCGRKGDLITDTPPESLLELVDYVFIPKREKAAQL